jgi:2-dehydro-3-deoxyphosphogluconate aldolase/(4S)-4-hydroxy-2-oxoglutarate aldolase
VIRRADARHAAVIAHGLSLTGVAAIEIPMTVPSAPSVIADLVQRGVRHIGAGTVRTVAQVRACADAGAEFIVSPHLDARLVEATLEAGLVSIPGVLTPSELIRAMELGATAAKLFPVAPVGGIAYLEALLEPIPDAQIVVSGGVPPEGVGDYLAAGAIAVCLGSALFSEVAVIAGDVDAIAAFAEKQLALGRVLSPA